MNFNFLVCYKNLFDIEGIVNNIGSYIILTIILFHIITIFFFYNNQFSLIKEEIKDIVSANSNCQIFANFKEKNESRKIKLNGEQIETNNYKANEMKTSNLPGVNEFQTSLPKINVSKKAKNTKKIKKNKENIN